MSHPLTCANCGADNAITTTCQLCGAGALRITTDVFTLLNYLDILDSPIDLLERAAFELEVKKLRKKLKERLG